LSTGSVVRFEHRIVQHVGPGKALSGRGLHFPPILTFHLQPQFRSKSFERHPYIAHNEPIESSLFLLLASCHSWRPPRTTDVYNNRTFPIPFNFSFGDIKDVFLYRFCLVVSVAIDLNLVNKVKSTRDINSLTIVPFSLPSSLSNVPKWRSASKCISTIPYVRCFRPLNPFVRSLPRS
jgi:hypothetical protein